MPVGHLVLTLPFEVRELVRDPADMAAWRAAELRAVHQWQRENWGLRGAECFGEAVCVHPLGDDGVTFHPHLEILFPLVSGDLSASGLVPLRRGKPFVQAAMLRRLRELRWLELHAWLVRRCAPGRARSSWFRTWWATTVPEVDTWYGYIRADDGKKMSHATRYAARTFPGWGWWAPAVRYYGLLACQYRGVLARVVEYNDLSVEFEPAVCPVCGRPFDFDRRDGWREISRAEFEAWCQDRGPPRPAVAC